MVSRRHQPQRLFLLHLLVTTAASWLLQPTNSFSLSSTQQLRHHPLPIRCRYLNPRLLCPSLIQQQRQKQQTTVIDETNDNIHRRNSLSTTKLSMSTSSFSVASLIPKPFGFLLKLLPFSTESRVMLTGEQIGQAVVLVSLALLAGRLKRGWIHRSMNRNEGESIAHLGFYNLLLNVLIGSITSVSLLKVFKTQTSAIRSIAAAGGFGAVVFGIASRNLAEQIVGGLVIAATDAYNQGDRIQLPQSGIEGTVERIGLIDTDIKGYDHSVIQYPNSKVLNQHIVNLSRVKVSRIKQQIRIRYQDLDKIPALVDAIPKEIERFALPVVITGDNKKNIRAFLSNLNEDHVAVTVVCHLHARPASPAYNRWRQQVLLGIGSAVNQTGCDFAMPVVKTRL